MIRYVILILTCINCASCTISNSANSEQNFTESEYLNTPISLLKTGQINLILPDSVKLAAPNYTFEMDAKGERIALFDAMTSRFLIFNSKGKFIKEIGRDGRGPEEFLMVYSYTFDENGNLIVYDDGLKRLKIFDADYELKHTIEVRNDRYYFASHKLFAENGIIITGVLETEYSGPIRSRQVSNSSIAGFFSYDLKDDELIGTYDPYLNEITPSTNRPVVHVNDGSLYTSHSNSYRIQRFDLANRNRTNYFGYRSENFGHLEEEINPREPLESRFRKGFEESSTRMIHTDNEYLYFYFINGSEEWMEAKDLNTLNYHLMVYDNQSLSFLGESKLPYRLSYARGNTIYLLENEDPDDFTYGIYEVVIK